MRLPNNTLLVCSLLLFSGSGDLATATGAGDEKATITFGEPRLTTTPYAWIEGYSVVAPYDQCLYIAGLEGGTAVDYKWTVTGATGQANGPYWIGSSSGSSIYLDVEITLNGGGKAYAFKTVTVDPWAGQCTWY
jgi:hypothetical protein